MARTKGAVGKKPSLIAESAKQTEPPKKTRGRQKGETYEKECVIVNLDKNYRVKIDKMNLALQELQSKQDKNDDIIDDEELEDGGFKTIGYYPCRKKTGWVAITETLVHKLTLKKASKDRIMTMEKYLTYFNQSIKTVNKMFAPLDLASLIIKDDSGEDE